MNSLFKFNLYKIGIMLLLLFGLTSCGQKGDLYLPSETKHSMISYSDSL